MPSDPSRRRTLAVLAGVGATGALAVVAIPAARLAAAPASGSGLEPPWLRIAKLEDLPEGAPRRVKIVADQHDGYATAQHQPIGIVWLMRKGTTIQALSATCPHLGCTIDLSPDGKQFYCPCHTSWFDLDGGRSAGKTNKALRGMDPLPVRVVGEPKAIEVQFKRFQVGSEKREAIG
jgi:menaquinol-cytochrome c reductase iron-sulfur subunit